MIQAIVAWQQPAARLARCEAKAFKYWREKRGMTSEDIYEGKSNIAPKSVLSQLKRNLSDLPSIDSDLLRSDQIIPCSADDKEYSAKGAIRRLQHMFSAGEDEI